MGSILTVKNSDFSAINLGQIQKQDITMENGGKFWVYSSGDFSRTSGSSWQIALAGSNRVEIPNNASYLFGITSGMIADSTTIVENAMNIMGIRTILFSDNDDHLIQVGGNDNNAFITKVLTKKTGLFLNNEYSAVVFETAMPIPSNAKYVRVNWGMNGIYTYNNINNNHKGYGMTLPDLSFNIEQ